MRVSEFRAQILSLTHRDGVWIQVDTKGTATKSTLIFKKLSESD